VNSIRAMTFNLGHWRGRNGGLDPERIRQIIAQDNPDIVALQEVDCPAGQENLSLLEKGLNMPLFEKKGMAANVFLSRFPLKGIQAFSLGGEGICLKADLDLSGKRIHLFNVCLETHPFHQFQQLRNLFSSDLVASSHLPCPKLILGDFGAFCPWLWILPPFLGQGRLQRPLWRPTYPACFPLFSRDRVYRLGEIDIRYASVFWNPLTRKASSHLPLSVTVHVRDSLDYLHAEGIRKNLETATGCFRKKAALR